MLSKEQAIANLLAHSDPDVRRAAEAINDGDQRRKRILALVQDALSQLRLDMKYIMFDLEATRRERDELKGQLGK
ncbi:MAG: transcriptional regulator [Planctomycetota bacterium]|jgi:hypothetical protein